ncbi:hypothetical protein EUTSA_v10000669mg, partial [Eutrema salsugineum]
MSSVGVFREEEMDGKPFHIYSIYSGESAIDSGDLDLPPLQPLFLCDDEFLPYKTSPHFHSTDLVQQHLLDSDRHDDICKLPVVPIIWCNNKEPDYAQFHCGACNKSMLGTDYYLCLIHQFCIYIPHVIKISRHHHRISFIPSLPSGKWSCGVCCKKIENSCGGYNCYKCSDYFVHTRCALRSDVWDGVDLEGVPEEPDIVTSRDYDEYKFCQGCISPIYEGNISSAQVKPQRCELRLHKNCPNKNQ